MKRLVGRADVVIALWALILLVIWTPSWAIWHPDSEVTILFAIAIAATLAKALSATWRARKVPEPGDREPMAVVGTTHATSLAGIAIVCGFLALEFGPWLGFVAGGLFVAAVGGWIRERRATRTTMERFREVPRR